MIRQRRCSRETAHAPSDAELSPQLPIVATRIALIVCRRFSA